MKIAAIESFHISVPYDVGNTAANAAATQWPKASPLGVPLSRTFARAERPNSSWRAKTPSRSLIGKVTLTGHGLS
jgi:hypothetical protein